MPAIQTKFWMTATTIAEIYTNDNNDNAHRSGDDENELYPMYVTPCFAAYEDSEL